MPLEDKTCIVCLHTAVEPSRTDLAAKKSLRTWGLRRFWGPFCFLCKKAAQVKWSCWSAQRMIAWVQRSGSNRITASLYAYAYETLREEGRVQIPYDMLEARVCMLRRSAEDVPALLRSTFDVVATVSDFAKSEPESNPLQLGLPIVQMSVNGIRRLGLRMPSEPAADARSSSWAPAGAVVGPYVVSDEPVDYDLMRSFAASFHQPKAPKFTSPAKPTARSSDDVPPADADDDADGPPHGHGDDSSGSEAMAEDSATDSFPRGRYGNAARKNDIKVKSFLDNLMTDEWRESLRDVSLRACLRNCAGFAMELQKVEYPNLITLNKWHTEVISTMMEASKAILGIEREGNSHNLKEAYAPLSKLAEYLVVCSGPSAMLYSELAVVMVMLWEGPSEGSMGFLSDRGPSEY